MDQQRILTTYLSHAPQNLLTPTTLHVFPTLANSYNPEGVARCIVATINRHLFVLRDSLGLSDLDIEDVQNYWANIAMMDCSGEPSAPPRVSDPNIHVLLSTAYNEVGFAWVTDFFLYPLNKRVPQLIPRKRSGESQAAAPIPVPHYVQNVDLRLDPIINVDAHRASSSSSGSDASAQRTRHRSRYPFPGGTPPTAANSTAHAHAPNVSERRRASEPESGLDGCKVINDSDSDPAWPLLQSAFETRRRRNSDSFLERGLSQWDAVTTPLQHDEESYGEALELRVGRYREKLKHDVSRRDGTSCAASGPSQANGSHPGSLFCTQIIPESFDTDRFGRFRRMVSVVFSGQYDQLLEHPSATSSPAANAQGSAGRSSDASMDHSAAAPPSRRSKPALQGHFPRPEHILRSSRNAINFSEQWLRWFDEGRFVLKEWGGQYYARCLDPALFHDPAFARQGTHPNDPWERGHGLRLDVGATPAGATVIPSQSASARQQQQQGAPAPIPSYHQLPTPVPTPTSPAPLSPFHEHQKLGFGVSPIIMPLRHMGDAPFHPQPLPSTRGTRAQRYRHRRLSSDTTPPSCRHVHPKLESVIAVPPPPPASSHAHHHPNVSSAFIPSHPQFHEGSPRHPGPFVAGQASRQAYHHSRNASNDSAPSSSTVPPSRHSITALLNPAVTPKLPPSVLSSAATARSKGVHPNASPYSVVLPPPSFHPTAVRAIRKELWDVDALDPRLVRLHEQVVTMWWETGLQTELAVQAQWVDREPLTRMNVRDLGEGMFAGVLQHKLTLL